MTSYESQKKTSYRMSPAKTTELVNQPINNIKLKGVRQYLSPLKRELVNQEIELKHCTKYVTENQGCG